MVRKLLFGVVLLFLSTSTVTAQAPGQVFVLVHGAFQDSSSWANVAPLLEAAGHTVISVDLPGHGADETPLNEITLASYRDAVIAAIETQDQPVVLVGHSFGGFTISNVAEAIPERVAKLVYVAAYLPRSGDSLVTLSGLDHNNGFTQENFLLADDFSYAYVLESDFLSIFCGDCTEAQAEQVMASRQNEPLAPLNEPITLTTDNFGRVPKAYILTAEDNAVSPQLQAYMLSQTPVDQVYALNTSHVPFVVAPDALAALLIAASES
jgi:pimeloyl-ACP methyl ester carboxylesterase